VPPPEAIQLGIGIHRFRAVPLRGRHFLVQRQQAQPALQGGTRRKRRVPELGVGRQVQYSLNTGFP
jgi:hypothetical protein